MSGRTLVLVACSKGKASEPKPALELYEGPMFRIRREWAEKLHRGVDFILSAKHHLLAPTERIEPYDLTLNAMSEPQREAWGLRVAEQLLPVTVPGDRLLVLAGKHYATAWPALLEAEGRLVERRRFRSADSSSWQQAPMAFRVVRIAGSRPFRARGVPVPTVQGVLEHSIRHYIDLELRLASAWARELALLESQ